MSKKNNRSRSLARVQPQQKDNPNVAVVVAQQGVGTPATMPRNMRAYIQEGYRGSKTVFRVVGHIARTGAGIKWKHYADKTKKRDLGETELLKLWENPSPGVAGSAFREAMIAYYAMTGNNYICGINEAGNPKGKFDELYNLRPDLTKIKVNDSGPQYYEFGTFTPPKRYDPQQVMHNKLFAGNDDVYGLSPIEVAAMLVDLQKAGQKWNLGLLSNMARPGGAWVTDALLGDTEYKGLKDEIRKKFAGPRNAGETAILHGGVKWQSMSMSPMELDWLESDTKTDRDIAGIFFNFPLFLLGLADSTYQNQSEARFALYTEIEFPLLDMFEASLNMWLAPRYGGYLGYAQEDVEAIQERLQQAKIQASERADTEFTGGTTTFLEAREIQGKKPLAVKDFVMIGPTPVHVEDLDEYIEAMAGKTISPPPPPPQLLPPHGGTTVTEVPPDEVDKPDSDTDKPSKALVPLSPLARPRTPFVKALDLSTTEQKQAYFKSVEAQRGKWEDEITGRLEDYFKAESRTILAAIGNAVDGDSASAKVDHALTVLQQQGTLKHLIVSLYQDVGTDSGEQVAKELKHDYRVRAIERKDQAANGRDLNLYSPDVLVYLLTLAGEKAKYIYGSERAELQAALAEGVQQGESIIQLAKRIDDLYLLQIIPNRSAVISATEVVAASNYGSQEAAKASGLTLNKVWLATEDGHTRPDHAAADGQKVGMDEPFEVGGDQLMFPGDNSLGAAADQIIRCRCTQYYERVQADDSGKSRNRKMNENHDALGRFGSGGSGGSGTVGSYGGGLSSEELSHVSGTGPVDGEHSQTVSVTLGDTSHSFTDSYTAGDITMMLTSDHAYMIHGSDKYVDSAHENILSDHPDSMTLVSDGKSGKTVMFTNQELEHDQIIELTDDYGVGVTHYARAAGDVGSYYDYADYAPDSGGASKNVVMQSLHKFVQSLPATTLTREQYRELLKVKRHDANN